VNEMKDEVEIKSLVKVPVSDLLRVLPFKANGDEMRNYLCGVLVTPYEKHALLVATNGHWLAIYESEEGYTDKDRILDMPDWFAKQIREGTENHMADEDDEGIPDIVPAGNLRVADESSRIIIVNLHGGEELVKPGKAFIDSKFPGWRKVVPDPSTLQRGLFSAFAPHYLASLHEAVPDESEHPLFCYQERDSKKAPAVFRFGGMPQMIVVLMPRSDSDAAPADWPKWMTP
jgi:hypothetical protein